MMVGISITAGAASDLFASAARLATPIGFVALGETFGEAAGIINIGLEGVMLASALAGAWAAASSGSVLTGFAVAMLTGMALLGVMALLCIGLRANQIVVGLGMNLVALGATTLVFKSVRTVALAPGLDPLQLGFLADIPFLGPAFFRQRLTFFVLLLLTAAAAFVLRRTAWGLRLRAVGETPAAADAAGVRVDAVRVQAMLVCGALAGLGGAALSIGELRGFTENMVAGKGFIALAAVIFGRWKPWAVLAACGVFGLADALQGQLPAWDINFPPSVLRMLPYLIALVALAVQRGRARPPAALSIPYERRR
ncbi:MAG: ABC transporter permease [Acidimicrobiales bacterium]|nr:ABC transporter permease [Acidimicrobiales bacterium]